MFRDTHFQLLEGGSSLLLIGRQLLAQEPEIKDPSKGVLVLTAGKPTKGTPNFLKYVLHKLLILHAIIQNKKRKSI